MRASVSRSTSLWLLLALTAVGFLSCKAKQFNEHTVSRQDEAAAVTVSTTLVAHWDDYVDVLDPEFTLASGEAALKKIIPSTMAIEEKVLRVFGGSLGISAGADGAGMDGGVRPSGGAQALPGLKDAGAVSSSQDPMLEYLAATALFQEVQLLNRYIQDAALRRDYAPYVVRLQIGVTPYARNMPYDVYATLSFFGDRPDAVFSPVRIDGARRLPGSLRLRRDDPQGLTPILVAPMLVTDNLEGALKSRALNTIRDLTLALAVLAKKVNVDAKLSSYTDELSHVIGTDINSLLTVSQVNDNSVRVRLGAPRQATAGHAMIPRTHNVTLLVLVPKDASADDLWVEAATELRHARTGEALDTPSARSRTKDIHERLKQYSRYVYPDSREWAHFCYEGLKSFLLHEYDTWTMTSDFEEFENALYSACDTTTASVNLWMELVELSGNRPYARTSFDLPEERSPRLPNPRAQTVVLMDDKEAGTMTAMLRGGRDLRKDQLFATLDVSVNPKEPGSQATDDTGMLIVLKDVGARRVERVDAGIVDGGTTYDAKLSKLTADGGAEPSFARVRFPATKVEVASGGQEHVKLVFPSLEASKLGEIVQGTAKLTLRMVEDSKWKIDDTPLCEGDPGWPDHERPSYDDSEARFQRDRVDCRTYEPVGYLLKEEKKKASFTLSSGAEVIRADDKGEGRLRLKVVNGADRSVKVALEISGAQIKKMEPAPQQPFADGRDVIEVKKEGIVQVALELENLSARSKVKVTGQEYKSAEGAAVKEGPEVSGPELIVEPSPEKRSTPSQE